MPLIAFFFVRIVRAGRVVWLLLADASTRKRVPWAFLRHRAGRDPIMMLQLAGIAAASLLFPMSFLLPERPKGLVITSCVGLWLMAAFATKLGRRRSGT